MNKEKGTVILAYFKKSYSNFCSFCDILWQTTIFHSDWLQITLKWPGFSKNSTAFPTTFPSPSWTTVAAWAGLSGYLFLTFFQKWNLFQAIFQKWGNQVESYTSVDVSDIMTQLSMDIMRVKVLYIPLSWDDRIWYSLSWKSNFIYPFSKRISNISFIFRNTPQSWTPSRPLLFCTRAARSVGIWFPRLRRPTTWSSCIGRFASWARDSPGWSWLIRSGKGPIGKIYRFIF